MIRRTILAVVCLFLLPACESATVQENRRLYPWLETCGSTCQETLRRDRLADIDGQTCVTLPEMYDLERTRNDLYWREAISDKATSLGCRGFP